eukprot:4231974-Pleurochrysis_carterae.AAC.1
MARYQDAMAIVSKKGKPTFFITMTCNPKRPEIQRELRQGATNRNLPCTSTAIVSNASDRPDLLAR